MALEIRGIPVLYGETAERFVREADATAANPRKESLSISKEDVIRMEQEGRDLLKKYEGNIQFK
jgi:hypothetical protein